MATDPSFASTVSLGAALLGAAETSLTVPVNSALIVNAGGQGTKIEEVVLHAATTSLAPTTVAGLVYLFLFDGTTYSIFDTLQVTVIVASATVPPFRLSKPYPNLFLKSTWSLKASQSIAGNANLIKCEAFGGDF